MTYVLGASALSALFYGAFFCNSAPSAVRVALKVAATSFLTLWAFLAGAPVLIIAALAFSVIGDAFLGASEETCLLPGMAAFFVAHAAYIPVFWDHGAETRALLTLAFQVAMILGGGMSSRLFQEVRERRGLAYSVSAGGARYSDTGSLTVSAGVTREHQEEALEVILTELRRLVDEPMGDEELQRTKDYAAGSFRLSLETPMSLGQRYGNQLLVDGEIESPEDTVAALRAVTAHDVQQVAERVIGPGIFSIAVVGPTADADRLDTLLHG